MVYRIMAQNTRRTKPASLLTSGGGLVRLAYIFSYDRTVYITYFLTVKHSCTYRIAHSRNILYAQKKCVADRKKHIAVPAILFTILTINMTGLTQQILIRFKNFFPCNACMPLALSPLAHYIYSRTTRIVHASVRSFAYKLYALPGTTLLVVSKHSTSHTTYSILEYCYLGMSIIQIRR